jgi:hypothetical protein
MNREAVIRIPGVAVAVIKARLISMKSFASSPTNSEAFSAASAVAMAVEVQVVRGAAWTISESSSA